MSSIPVSDQPGDASSQAVAVPREHIDFIEYFRGLAILLIVAGHTYALAWTHGIDEDPTRTTSWLNIVPALIAGGTAYFVFISGLLYREVFHDRVSYRAFMRKKALFVGMPYLVLGTPIAVALLAAGSFGVSITKDGVAYPDSPFIGLVALLSTGRMVTAYWYIPFIFLIFLASPLFDRFIRLRTSLQLGILAAFMLLAFWVHRPSENLDPVHSLLYFTQYYLLGIIFSLYRRQLVPRLTSCVSLLAMGALLLAVAAFQALVLQRVDNIERAFADGWLPLGFDAMIVQKWVSIFFLCGLLARYGHLIGGVLRLLATYSFGIFFAHGVILAFLIRLPERATAHTGIPLLDLALYTALVVLLSFSAVFVVKAVAGRYSRYIIGT